MGYYYIFDQNKCVGCLACHTACLSTHDSKVEGEQSFRTMKKWTDEDAGFQKNICPGCTHCGACAAVCPEQAIVREHISGIIGVDEKRCVGCKICESACPIHVIRYRMDGKMEKCDGCIDRLNEQKEPACVKNCPVGAILLEER